MIFTPSSSLAGEKTYTATLTTGIYDRAGNHLAQNYTWTFTTAGQAPVANAGPETVSLPEGDVLLASEALDGRSLPQDTTVWLRA